MKRLQLKLLVRNLIKEALGQYISSTELNKQLPQQKKVVSDLERYGYHIESIKPDIGGRTVTIVMSKSSGRFGGNEILIGSDCIVKGDASDIPMSYRGSSSGIAIVEKIKAPHYKSFIKNMVKEAVLKEIFDEAPIQNMTPVQKQTVSTLMKSGFVIQKTHEVTGGMGVILLRPKGNNGMPERVADVKPDGSINDPNVDIKHYLATIIGGKIEHNKISHHNLEKQTKIQSRTVQRLEKSGYYLTNILNINNLKLIKVVMEKSCGRFANDKIIIGPDGRVYKKSDAEMDVVGEVMLGQERDDHRFDDGRESVMRAVNVEESASKKEGDTVQVADGSGVDSGKIGIIVPTKFKQTNGGLIPDEPGAYKPQLKGWLSVKFEDGHVASFPANRLQIPFSFLKNPDQTTLKEGRYDERPCDCGSGLMSRWVLDARNIPLVRACDKCRKEKLSHYRPDVLTNPNYEADEPIEPDEQEEQTGTGAIAGYSTPFAFKKKNAKEMIMPDGRYEDDMESALHSKSTSGMDESTAPYDSELDVHGKPCPCGSGLPSHIKIGATGKPLARVCRKCDKPNPKMVKDYRASERHKRRIPYKFDEIANFDVALLSAAGGLALYKILRGIIDNLAAHHEWKNRRLTPYVIDAIFKAVKKCHPELKDEELYYFKEEVAGAVSRGEIRTVDDLKRYFETKKLEESNKRRFEEGFGYLSNSFSIIQHPLGEGHSSMGRINVDAVSRGVLL